MPPGSPGLQTGPVLEEVGLGLVWNLLAWKSEIRLRGAERQWYGREQRANGRWAGAHWAGGSTGGGGTLGTRGPL